MRGDFQTPQQLARAVVARIVELGIAPATVVEPTCGKGAFLQAASALGGRRLGWELDPAYAAEASRHGEVVCADFVDVDWAAEAARWARPVLILGNPPWVVTGRLAGGGPARENPGLPGLDAITGAGGFDVAEWMIRRLHAAAPDATIAVLCKVSVARRLLLDGLPVRRVEPVDARRWFGASVEAGLVLIDPTAERGRCRYDGRTIGVVDGQLVEDLDAWTRWRHLGGDGPAWRSGVKHDAARVLELSDGRNRLGEVVDVEPEATWPLLKGGELFRGAPVTRRVLLPQRRLGDGLDGLPPRARAYLERHAAVFDGRRSRIYRDRFAVFGLGDYTFAPWKVAVAGLYPEPRFRVVGPVGDRPVVLDDTCYFLPFADEPAARRVAAWLAGEGPQAWLRARIAPGAKRPITARLLRSLAIPGCPTP